MFHLHVYHRYISHKGGYQEPIPATCLGKGIRSFLLALQLLGVWTSCVNHLTRIGSGADPFAHFASWTRPTAIALATLTRSTSLALHPGRDLPRLHSCGGLRQLLLHLGRALRHLLWWRRNNVVCCFIDLWQQLDQGQLHPLVLGATVRVQGVAEKDPDLSAQNGAVKASLWRSSQLDRIPNRDGLVPPGRLPPR